jgi:hypothetical protein
MRVGISILLISTLSSCYPTASLEVRTDISSGSPVVTFYFTEKVFLIRRNVAPCLEEFTVHSTEDGTDPVWKIEASDGTCSSISNMTYGELPPGFDESKGKEELLPGNTYVAAFQATDRNGPSETFIVPQQQ